MATNNAVNNAPNANLAQHSVPVVGAAGLLSSIGPLTNGQLCIGSTSNAPVAGNLTSTGGSIAITNGAGTINLESVYYSLSPYIVGLDAQSQYNTIQAGINAAAAAGGGSVYIKPGTYTENPNLADGVDLVGFGDNTIIQGKCSFSGTGEVAIQGITLQTNGDYALEVSGSSASFVNLIVCYINCTNHTGINYTSSSANSKITVFDSDANIGTTGITLLTQSSPGFFRYFEGDVFNDGNSTTPVAISAGSFVFAYSTSFIPFSASSSGVIYLNCAQINSSNNVCITTSGSGAANIFNSILNAGTASCISIGSGSISRISNSNVTSTNTNVFTGAGTIYTGSNACTNSSGNNVSTINHYTII